MIITIPAKPAGQKRPRARAFKTNTGKYVAQAYKDTDQAKVDHDLKMLMLYERDRTGVRMISGPLKVRVKAVFTPPKSWSKKKKADALKGIVRPTGKPDLSNLVKTIEDVANGVLWDDDARIVEYMAGTGKYYGETAHWEIEVKPVAKPKRRAPALFTGFAAAANEPW